MDFATFTATRRDVGQLLIYCDDYHIGKAASGYWLVIENCQWESTDLEKLERILWAWSLEGEHVLSGDSGFDLDRFIQGYCESRGRAIDGDLFAILFSGPKPYTVAQATDLLLAGFVHPLYCEHGK